MPIRPISIQGAQPGDFIWLSAIGCGVIVTAVPALVVGLLWLLGAIQTTLLTFVLSWAGVIILIALGFRVRAAFTRRRRSRQ